MANPSWFGGNDWFRRVPFAPAFYFNDEWWAAPPPPSDQDATLLAVQGANTSLLQATFAQLFDATLDATQTDNTFGGSSPWYVRDWSPSTWYAVGWNGGSGARLAFADPIPGGGEIVAFDIPDILVAPVWQFSSVAGRSATLAGLQAAQVGPLTMSYNLAADRSGTLYGVQAPQTGQLQASFVPSITTRDSTLLGVQVGDSADINADYVFSGGSGDRRYGRK